MPEIHLMEPEAWERARSLFARYPYKQPQRIAQRLDETRLLNFYLDGLRRSLAAGRPCYLVEHEGEALALAGMSQDTWQSEVYGKSIGRLQPWLNTIHPASGAALLKQVLSEGRAAGVEHLSVRIDGADFVNLHLFTGQSWHLVDVSLKFTLDLPLPARRFAPPKGDWRVEVATAQDAPWIERLAGQCHAATHYLNDPDLPPDATRELFARWVRRCLGGLAYRIYVLRDAAGAGRGFVTYLRNEGFARAVGRTPLVLDFVILDPAVRGGGLGPWFIEETLSREAASGFDYCELRTSAHNLPAVMGYEKLGMRCCASDFVLHRLVNAV